MILGQRSDQARKEAGFVKESFAEEMEKDAEASREIIELVEIMG
jgi:hypothetical protein